MMKKGNGMSDMNEQDFENARVAKEVVQSASKTAAHVALEAIEVAKQVANQAAQVASDVAKTAQKTAESVLILSQDIGYIKNDIKEIKDKLDNKYTTKEEHKSLAERVSSHEISIATLNKNNSWVMLTVGFGTATMSVLIGLLIYHITK